MQCHSIKLEFNFKQTQSKLLLLNLKHILTESTFSSGPGSSLHVHAQNFSLSRQNVGTSHFFKLRELIDSRGANQGGYPT